MHIIYIYSHAWPQLRCTHEPEPKKYVYPIDPGLLEWGRHPTPQTALPLAQSTGRDVGRSHVLRHHRPERRGGDATAPGGGRETRTLDGGGRVA